MIKNHKIIALLGSIMIISLCSCGKKETLPPDGDNSSLIIDNNIKDEKEESILKATVIDIKNDIISVEPVENSIELNSSDKFNIQNKENIEFQIGDLIEIFYNGDILETYPAQLGEVYKINIIEPVESSSTLNRVRMLRVDDDLYYDTGEETRLGGRCGNFDGEITSSVKSSEIPTKDNQSNFGTGFNYQYGEDNTIEIYMDKIWHLFNKINENELIVIKTYDVTDPDKSFEDNEIVTIVPYYEMSDGTWKTDNHTYKYRLEITGKMANAEKDSTFVYLSNLESITFKQAWKASGLSSNMSDYFNEEDAKFVALK